MAKVIPNLVTAEIEGGFVVFLIGMRINKFWKIHKWLPVFLAVRRVLRELEAHRESGFLGYFGAGNHRLLLSVQYWTSFDHLAFGLTPSYMNRQQVMNVSSKLARDLRRGLAV